MNVLRASAERAVTTTKINACHVMQKYINAFTLSNRNENLCCPKMLTIEEKINRP